jgi:tRNA pseudouridine38-40 synthase
MKNIRLEIAYDGSNYAGWQVQPDALTIQGTLEAAIKSLSGEDVRLHGSGRTDAGVHALAQVANFLTSATIPPERWRPALNGVLPRDIVVNRSELVAADFHARYSAKQKTYRYVIHNSIHETLPLLRTQVWTVPCQQVQPSDTRRGQLDVQTMHEAAQSLIGTHDFSSFESKSAADESSVRTVSRVMVSHCRGWQMWRETAEDHQDYVSIEITADGFLYNMVRSIVGTLVEVGSGSRPPEDVRSIMTACDRSQAGPTAPPDGLYLVGVDYEGDPLS